MENFIISINELHIVNEPYKSLLEKIVRLLEEKFGENLISVAVYGSVARGDNRKDSDIDLLIIVKNLPKTFTERVILFDEVERKLEGDIEKLMNEGYYISFSPIIKTPEEAVKFTPLYMDMTEDAIILYDKENFLKKILDDIKIKLQKLGFERIWFSKSRWYWRKKDYKFGEVINFE